MSSAIFTGAHDFTLTNALFSQTVNIAPGSGIKKLLDASLPEAFHDSGARDPPRCHPGTRLDYIELISSWGLGTSQHPEHILWMQGPAGAGKSAIAQSCAELLAKRKHLGAAFFFSRPNQRDDPTCLFTSISYQIATKFSSFSTVVDRDIRNDPTLVRKSIAQQFQGLLVNPLEEMKDKEDMKDYMIIIDGLDECVGIKAQQEIVEIVAKSVREATTPFRWAFFSRPELHIVAPFTSDRLRSQSLHIVLPVSREIDHEIMCYLTSEFEKIREEYSLPLSWPSEGDLGILVDRSAGLFIYAATLVRFVGERNSLGPIEQLRLVLSLTRQVIGGAGSDHPLSELDLFYMLIMQRVPSKVLSMIRNILLFHSTNPAHSMLDEYSKVQAIANGLSLSEHQIQSACAALRSVLEFDSLNITFYHASFMDFLQDPGRSNEFCIYGDCLDVVRQTLLERLNRVHARGTVLPKESIFSGTTWTSLPGSHLTLVYRYLVNSFFLLCSHPRPLLPSTAAALVEFQFSALPRLYRLGSGGGSEIIPKQLRQNVVPIELQDKLVRRSYDPILYLKRPLNVGRTGFYVVGQGENKAVWSGGALAAYPSIFES